MNEIYAIGIGITDKCNCNCKHCYSRPADNKYNHLEFDQVKNLVNNLQINSINLGTGESALHPDFHDIIDYLKVHNIKTSLTTNGYSINQLNDEQLSFFNDIDFSLDFPDEDNHNVFRDDNVFKHVVNGIERCKKLGVEVSIVTVLMNTNYDKMDQMLEISKKLGTNLRVNIYKEKHTTKYKLSYSQFWDGVKILLDNSRIISCSEPIINAVIGNKTLDGGSPCGKISVRINPLGQILPCVYWSNSEVTINDLVASGSKIFSESETFQHANIIPERCKDLNCEHLDICKGGCAARRAFNDIEKPDPYCFKERNEVPELNVEWAEQKDLVHSDYICTLILEAK